MTVGDRIRSLVARAAVCTILGVVLTVAWVSGWLRHRLGTDKSASRGDQRCLLLTGTFYNPGWFRAHIMPLSCCRALDRIIVVCDEPLFDVDKVRYACPPGWLVRCAGRTLAKLIMITVMTGRYRPATLMGYHIMPNALLCLLVASLFGYKSVYQMTGGPIQVIGGGVGSENKLLRHLLVPSPLLEKMMYSAVRQFNEIIVRGSGARDFVQNVCSNPSCTVLTGSVDMERFSPASEEKQYDLVYVSRLVPCKGLEQFLNIVKSLVTRMPSLQVAVVGDGCLMPELQQTCRDYAIEDNVNFLGRLEHVEKILRTSRLFVLVSPSEGMSIAMLEAMSAGLPTIVNDVGDLRDMVLPDTGVLLDSVASDDVADILQNILTNPDRIAAMSQHARALAVKNCSVEAIAGTWERLLSVHDMPDAVASASGVGCE